MKKYCFMFCVAASFLLCSACVTGLSSNKDKVITAYMPSKYLKYYIRPGKMTAEESGSKSYLMIDFSYQMDKRNYVSNAYVNFTLYNRSDAYIDAARFSFPNDEDIELTELSILDRDTSKGYIRVSTILEQNLIEKVLKGLHESVCGLTITLENGSTLSFVATDDLKLRIGEAFSK